MPQVPQKSSVLAVARSSPADLRVDPSDRYLLPSFSLPWLCLFSLISLLPFRISLLSAPCLSPDCTDQRWGPRAQVSCLSDQGWPRGS